MAVPNTNTFGLQDVVNEVVPSVDGLVECFAEANDIDFDPIYEGLKNGLLNFRNYGAKAPILFVDGVGGTITTLSLFVFQLEGSNVNDGNYFNFTTDGTDISIHASVSFNQKQISWIQGTATAFIDTKGQMSNMQQGVFADQSQLKTLYIPNCLVCEGPGGFFTMRGLSGLHHYFEMKSLVTINNHYLTGATSLKILRLPSLTNTWIQNIGRNQLQGMSSLERCYLPLLQTIVYPDGLIRTLQNVKSGCVFYVHANLETSNGGNREQLIAELEDNQGAIIVYINNTTSPNKVTNLSTSSITTSGVTLNFTAPSSTNTLDFYEVWIEATDGSVRWHKYFSHQEISGTGRTVIGLSSSTNYDIKIVACDQYYNRSEFSNILNFTTL